MRTKLGEDVSFATGRDIMVPVDEKLNFAVFIDYDNIEIGVKSTLHREFDVDVVLEGIKERGEIAAKVAYGNWSRQGQATRAFTEHGVQMVQRDSTPRGDKNGGRHQPGARCARDGLHARAHQRLRHRQRRQRLHGVGQQAQAVQQARLHRRRQGFHQHDSAAQLPRVHQLRVVARFARDGFAAGRAADASGRGQGIRCRFRRPFL